MAFAVETMEEGEEGGGGDFFFLHRILEEIERTPSSSSHVMMGDVYFPGSTWGGDTFSKKYNCVTTYSTTDI